MPLTDPEEFAQAVIEALKCSGHTMWIDPKSHADQHEFIAEMIAERRERKERRRRMEEKIAGSLVLSGIMVLIGLLGAGVLAWARGS